MLLLALHLGCAHRVRVVSVPPGAFIYRDDARIGTAPMDLRVRMFSNPELSLRLPGYRQLTFEPGRRISGPRSFWLDLRRLRWGRALGLSTSTTLRVLLVPDHATVAREGARAAAP